jgi:hypothetical protein
MYINAHMLVIRRRTISVWTKTGRKVETVSGSNSNPKMQKKQETDTTPETNNSPKKTGEEK